MLYAKMQIQAIIVGVRKDSLPNRIRKLPVNKLMSIFCVQAISIVQIMRNVLKDNVSVKMALNLKDLFVLISMNAAVMKLCVEQMQSVLILLARSDVNARGKTVFYNISPSMPLHRNKKK